MGFIQVRDSQLEVVTYFSNTSHLEPIEQTIFDFLHTPQTVKALLKDKEVQKAIGDRCKTYRQSLINQRYIRACHQLRMCDRYIGSKMILGKTSKADNQKFLCVFVSYGSRYPKGLRETFFMREQ